MRQLKSRIEMDKKIYQKMSRDAEIVFSIWLKKKNRILNDESIHDLKWDVVTSDAMSSVDIGFLCVRLKQFSARTATASLRFCNL